MQMQNKTMHGNVKINWQVNTPLQRKLRLHLNICGRKIFRQLLTNTYNYSCAPYRTKLSRHLQLLAAINMNNRMEWFENEPRLQHEQRP